LRNFLSNETKFIQADLQPAYLKKCTGNKI